MKAEQTCFCSSVPLMPCFFVIKQIQGRPVNQCCQKSLLKGDFFIFNFFFQLHVLRRGNMNNTIPLGLKLPGLLPALLAGTAATAEDWSSSFLIFQEPSCPNRLSLCLVLHVLIQLACAVEEASNAKFSVNK